MSERLAGVIRRFALQLRTAGFAGEVPKPELQCILRIFWVNGFPFGEDGSAVFPTACYCAHSCTPNAAYYTDGRHAHVVAMQPLCKGDLIEISYIQPPYMLLPRDLRQQYIESTRGFCCLCNRCIGEQDSTVEDEPTHRSRLDVELDVIAFAENPAALDFEDGSEILPRGVQLEVLLAQCSMYGRLELTFWLLRLRVYRDLARLAGYLNALRLEDLRELILCAGAVHQHLYQKLDLGLFSPFLEGELHRPKDLTTTWLTCADILSLKAQEIEEASLGDGRTAEASFVDDDLLAMAMLGRHVALQLATDACKSPIQCCDARLQDKGYH
ncbi:unnamed protein product [Durusdinium trenchii]|uniref:SET domain-containing protein n=1 Tax=Durusdinium trenchii TaxID=1381693 RepID=A0ABP0J519_9DINO